MGGAEAETKKINGWLLAVDRGPQFLSLLLLFFLPFATQLKAPNPIHIKQILAGLLVSFILVFWVLKPAIEGKWVFIRTPALLPGAVLLLWCIVTSILSPYPAAAWHAWREWMWAPLWFFLLTQTCYELWRAENLLMTFMAASLGTAFWGFSQTAGWPKSEWFYAVRLEHSGRVIAGMGKPEYLAGYLLLVWPFALALLIRAKSRFAKVFWAVTLVSAWSCLALTQSAPGWLGAWAGILTMVTLMRKERASFKTGWIALALAFLLMSIIPFTGNVSRSLADGFNPRSFSRSFQSEVWKGAVEILKERPILGSGFGTFRAAFPSRRSVDMMMRKNPLNYEVEHADNFVLEWTAETGVLGLLLLMAFWASVAWSWWKLHRSGAIPPSIGAAAFAVLAGSGANNLVNMDHTLPTTVIPLLFLAALPVPLSRRFLTLPGYPIRKAEWKLGRFRPAVLLAFLAVALLAMFHVRDGLNRQWADVELKKGILLSSPGRWDEAVLQYDKALRLQPDDLMAQYFLAYVLLERNRDGDPQRSVELLKRVAAVEPDYAYVHLKMSRALEMTGDKAGAEREMTAAIRQDPLLVQEAGDFKNAREFSRLGDFTQALALYQALALRHPLCPPLWYEIGVTCTMLKRPEDAIYAYKRALSIYPTYIDALRNLGYVASTVGMMDEVLRVMDTLRRTFPDQPWVNELERQFGEAVPTPSKGPRN